MEIARKAAAALLIALLSLGAVACSAEGEIDEGGAEGVIEGEEGGEGEE